MKKRRRNNLGVASIAVAAFLSGCAEREHSDDQAKTINHRSSDIGIDGPLSAAFGGASRIVSEDMSNLSFGSDNNKARLICTPGCVVEVRHDAEIPDWCLAWSIAMPVCRSQLNGDVRCYGSVLNDGGGRSKIHFFKSNNEDSVSGLKEGARNTDDYKIVCTEIDVLHSDFDPNSEGLSCLPGCGVGRGPSFPDNRPVFPEWCRAVFDGCNAVSIGGEATALACQPHTTYQSDVCISIGRNQ